MQRSAAEPERPSNTGLRWGLALGVLAVLFVCMLLALDELSKL